MPSTSAEARPQQPKYGDGRGRRKHGNSLPDRRITLADLVSGKVKGRTSPDQITYSKRENLQGAQFHAVAGKVYELAKRAALAERFRRTGFSRTFATVSIARAKGNWKEIAAR